MAATVMKTWQVPGMAIGVVKDGAVAYRQGFGLRNIEKQLPVTPQTLFPIGSCTKAFTACALGMLVDQRKADIDVPIKTFFPSFKMFDGFATQRLTLRDLLLHRSGLPAHDLIWYGTPASREEIVSRIQYLQPNEDPRYILQYQNLMYMLAGYILGKVEGTSWEGFMSKRVLPLLQMNATNLSVSQLQQTRDFALPYTGRDGKVVQIPFRNVDAIGPAGSMNSNIDEMTQWVRSQLNLGTLDGVHVVSSAFVAEMHRAQMVYPLVHPFLEQPPPTGYGLGWEVKGYRGSLTVAHGGSIDGFRANVALIPSQNSGIIVLANANPIVETESAPEVMTYQILDRLLGLDHIDWNRRLWDVYQTAVQTSKAAVAHFYQTRRTSGSPPRPYADYVGVYTNPGYGALTVTLAGNQLTANLHSLVFPMVHHDADTFGLQWPAKDVILPGTFYIDPKGIVASVAVPFEGALPPIVFRRK